MLDPIADKLQKLLDALFSVVFSKSMQDDILHEPDVVAFVDSNIRSIQKLLYAMKRGCDTVWKALERNFPDNMIPDFSEICGR